MSRLSPTLLLHLNRFDFDFTTLQREKLNDDLAGVQAERDLLERKVNELRRELRTGRERPLCAVVGLPADRDPTDDDKPPRVETYHQLLLHIHVLDAALNFNG